MRLQRAIFSVQIKKNIYYCIYYLDILKTYQRESKLLDFSQDANKEELKIRKNNVTLQIRKNDVTYQITKSDVTLRLLYFSMALLCKDTTSLSSSYVGFKTLLFASLCLQTKLSSFLTKCFHTGKFRSAVKGKTQH